MSVRSARYNLLSLRNPKGLTVIPEERDAWAFLDATGIRSSRQQRAVIELVRGLKHAQLWTKMKAIYPFVGGTATTHKYNLKDPRDADAAFRLSFSGGWTHSSTGALPNGSTAYANTYFNTTSNGTANSGSISYYSRTNNAVGNSQIEMGSLKQSPDSYSDLYFGGFNLTLTRWCNNALSTSTTPTNTTGYIIGSRTSSTLIKTWRNNTLIITGTQATSGATSSANFFIGAVNNWGSGTTDSPLYYTNRETAFATIGDGLTDTDATALYAIVQRFQLALGRQIEPDASAFIAAAGITDTTQQNAINDLVISLKNEGLWSKMKAIYPFVGGTATTHKFNLKDPRDADAAYRLSFSGGWTHASTGATGNGTNSYADTFLVPSSSLSSNNTHSSVYSRTNTTGAYSDFSSYDGANGIFQKYISYDFGSGAKFVSYMYFQNVVDTGGAGFPANTNSTGFYVTTRTNSTTLKAFKNSAQLGQTTTSLESNFADCTRKLYIGARNNAGTADSFSPRQYAFATIGDGLTDTDATALYNIVQRFQTSLGRQV